MFILFISGYGKTNVSQSTKFFTGCGSKTDNTRNMLRRKNMELESYTCENCIWQKEETLYHLFLRCNFAKACWNSIGMNPPRIAQPEEASANLKQQLNVPFFMEIIILMTWSI
jgi:hypothetical protein